MIRFSLVIPFMACALLCAPSQAPTFAAESAAPAQTATSEEGQATISLSVGVATIPDYEGSDNYKADPLVFGRIQQGPYYLALEGTKLSANVIPSERFQFGPLVRYRFNRGSVQNNRVDEFEHVSPAVEVGAFVKYKLDPVTLGLEASQDVAGGHNGYLIRADIAHDRKLTDTLSASGRIFSTYASDGYMGTYFGVDAADSRRSGLDEDDASAGIKDVGLQLTATYAITDHWNVTGIGGYTRLLGDAADSPIVDDEGSANQFFLGLAVGYTFSFDGF